MQNAEDAVTGQSGRLAVITGSNSGLGFEAALALARAGAAVVLAVRSGDRGRQAKEKILAAHPEAEVMVETLDVASLASVRDFAGRLAAWGRPVDLLINNAGIMAVPYARSPDGFELQFATNHLGHFALTGLLLPQFAPGARVVAVSSIAAHGARIDFDDLQGEKRYRPWRAYAQSKLANLLFVLELQRRLERAGLPIMAVAAHPGTARTELFATGDGALSKRLIAPLLRPALQAPAQAVRPILFAATATTAEAGGYYGPAGRGERRGPPAPARMPQTAKEGAVWIRLWEVSQSLTGVHYPQR